MTTVKFEILSDKSGSFDVDSFSYTDQQRQLGCSVSQEQYASIILKINQRMKKLKYPMSLSCLIGLVMIILIIIIFGILQITLESTENSYQFLVAGAFFISLIGTITACCAVCDNCSAETKKERSSKLQFDIQKIADEEFMSIYQVPYSKWTIELVDDQTSNKKYKLTVEFRLPQPRARQMSLPAVYESMDWTSTQLDPTIGTSDCLSFEIATQTLPPPPPSYQKVIHLFSQGIFSDCPNCGIKKCIFNGKYCTQCGFLLSISDV